MNGNDFQRQRFELVERHLKGHGIRNERVLKAVAAIPREEFVAPEFREFAYRNASFPIGEGETMSQPFVVAVMAEAMDLKEDDRVLEIGTGSGYGAAIFARLANEVFTIERHEALATKAAVCLNRQGIQNVYVMHGDGSLGWPENAPYDAIAVATGGPDIPELLLEQLKIGGKLVIPVGLDRAVQKLIRVTRVGEDEFRHEELGELYYVAEIGQVVWRDDDSAMDETQTLPDQSASLSVSDLIRDALEPFESIEEADLEPLLNRIGDARLVLIGEATHGTSEFYHMRARISKALIEKKGFDFVAVEADWPDASRINNYVTHRTSTETQKWTAFERFPTWMWRNYEVLEFVNWLRLFNVSGRMLHERVAFYGLDLYSLFNSVKAVLDYLDRVDPQAASIARERYGCLTPWQGDPQSYGRAAVSGIYKSCEEDVARMLKDLLERQFEYAQHDGEFFMDAALNAKLVADAEKYYRVMYYGGDASWNLRDRHMFETLETLLQFHGPVGKGIIWAHNSHLGDDSATEMGMRGQINLGYLCRQKYRDQAYLIGQTMDHGTVAAASQWDEPMTVMDVRPALPQSYERLFHDAGLPAGFLPLRTADANLRRRLETDRIERAIGVVYRPQTELQSHYFRASLPHQFDEIIWFDDSTAISPVSPEDNEFSEAHHPFAMID